jgi:hypothetical protein
MPHPGISSATILVFTSLADLSAFKHGCACDDFYVDRDLLSLVGNFTEEQVELAVSKYQAYIGTRNIV